MNNCGNYVKYNVLKLFAGGIADSRRTRFLSGKQLPDNKQMLDLCQRRLCQETPKFTLGAWKAPPFAYSIGSVSFN
eukprot:15024321-Heterocapsa_arctica.AAC.1